MLCGWCGDETQEHRGYYCSSCDLIVCPVCVIEEHRSHQTQRCLDYFRDCQQLLMFRLDKLTISSAIAGNFLSGAQAVSERADKLEKAGVNASQLATGEDIPSLIESAQRRLETPLDKISELEQLITDTDNSVYNLRQFVRSVGVMLRDADARMTELKKTTIHSLKDIKDLLSLDYEGEVSDLNCGEAEGKENSKRKAVHGNARPPPTKVEAAAGKFTSHIQESSVKLPLRRLVTPPSNNRNTEGKPGNSGLKGHRKGYSDGSISSLSSQTSSKQSSSLSNLEEEEETKTEGPSFDIAEVIDEIGDCFGFLDSRRIKLPRIRPTMSFSADEKPYKNCSDTGSNKFDSHFYSSTATLEPVMISVLDGDDFTTSTETPVYKNDALADPAGSVSTEHSGANTHEYSDAADNIEHDTIVTEMMGRGHATAMPPAEALRPGRRAPERPVRRKDLAGDTTSKDCNQNKPK